MGLVDRLAEKSCKWNPYNYVVNNPLRFIDPDGMEPEGIAESFLDTDMTWGGASYLMYNPIEPKRDKNPPAAATAPQNSPFYSFNSRAQSRREQMAGPQQGIPGLAIEFGPNRSNQ
jgi:hypothetical protein